MVIGTIGIFREVQPKISHKAMIWGMYVDTECRRTGLGRQLVDRALAFAKIDMKVELVQLSVESTNLGAKALYEAVGFRTWGRELKAMKFGNDFFDEDHMFFAL